MSSYEDDLNLEKDFNHKKTKHEKIIDQLKDIESFEFDDFTSSTNTTETTSSFLPSSLLKPQKKKKEKEEDDYDPDEWFADLMGSQSKISKTRKRIKSDLFDGDGIVSKKKKKKKKHGKNDGLVDFKQEFEPEMALYKNLLVAQNRFTDSLQKEYDAIKSVKSSSRGVTKQMSELIENITDARALSMQLIDKHVNVKKQIAELNMKQKEKFAKDQLDGDNMSDFASSYLRQMLNDRQALLDPTGNASVSDYSDEDMLGEINLSFANTDENDENFNSEDNTDLYLKYENQNVQVYVVITNDDLDNYEFVAEAEDGTVIDDYPLPSKTKISINRSTNVATDYYGQKYQIRWN